MGSKRLKMEEEKQDRISDLPDSLIQHILSFLPSTKQAIQTGVLSKRWQKQWTEVPVLIFNSDGMSDEKKLKFIANTLILHDCSKIYKFHLYLHCFHLERDPQIDSKIRFAISKDVEDLNLSLSVQGFYLLLQFLFNNASLVQLKTAGCTFIPNGKVNWGCLTVLNIRHCKLTDQAIEHLVSGSPLLESLELISFFGCHKIVIASKSLKRLVLHYGDCISVLEISCPKLVELCLKGMVTNDPKLFENVLSGSSLLESVSIESIYFRRLDRLVIASKSLKRLVVGSISGVFDIEISCPKFEKLKLLKFLNVNDAKLLNLPSSLCATINFRHPRGQKTCKGLIKDILQQLQHVKELKFGSLFISILPNMKVGDGFSPLLNIKYLTLDSPHLVKHHSGISYVLRISHVLEKLIINVPPYCKANPKGGNNYWLRDATVFDCLESHLKTIKIVGFDFPEGDARRQHMLYLVQFLLKNARVLEKMVVIVKDDGTGFPLEVSHELLSLPRCSQNAIIEFVCSKEIGNFL
ncbi:putative F-box/LRR-repeat protein At3g18150 isoform X1 [Euphorbia lathyris]|uniref:putative F-box/LRR-repeat protein At3g18150 isoform X1 n=1 Tax=Euphorbia lathyris TaxID=212925 RepID=UPI00331373C1